MPKDILKDFDTVRLSEYFFLCRNELYFISYEEIVERFNKSFDKLKEII